MVGAIIGAAGALAGGIASLISANRARKKLLNEQAIVRQKAAAEANKNILETDEGKSVMKQLRDQQDRQTKKANTATVRGGLTDEARVGMAEQQNKAQADAVSRLAAMGSADNRQARQQYNAILGAQAEQNYAMDMNKASAIGQAVSQFGQAASGMEQAFSQKQSTTPTVVEQPIHQEQQASGVKNIAQQQKLSLGNMLSPKQQYQYNYNTRKYYTPKQSISFGKILR